MPHRIPGTLRPGGLEERERRGPRDWGLCSRDANLHPEVEKGQRLASYGPMRKGRVRGSVCVSCLTGVLGFSDWASQREGLSNVGPGPGGTEQYSCSPWLQSPVGAIAIPAF